MSRGKSLSFRETSSHNRTPTKTTEKSDSGSRSSSEFIRAHSRERSFEKSLENIMDKCSEKSVDLNISLESKNGMVSDSSRVEDSSMKKSSDKGDKKKKNTPWYTVSMNRVNVTFPESLNTNYVKHVPSQTSNAKKKIQH
jgi:hypothetical protein